MTRATFMALYRSARWLVVIGLVGAFILLGDFAFEGGNALYAAFAMLPAMLFLARLVFTRCAHCRWTLGWISAHKNFDAQPDPLTLDFCPNCGEPFFKPSE